MEEIGLIQIKSTQDGEEAINVSGAYINRLQHGLLALIKTANLFALRIEESGEIGYSSSPRIHERLPSGRKPLPLQLTQDTNFGALGQ